MKTKGKANGIPDDGMPYFLFVINHNFHDVLNSAPKKLTDSINRFQIHWSVRAESLHRPFGNKIFFLDSVGRVSCFLEFLLNIFVNDHGNFLPFR